MEVIGEEYIEASPYHVWCILNDTTLLIDCIPGCEKLERISEDRIEATLCVKIGVIKLRFYGTLILSNINPPYSYTISGEGKGSISGMAMGKTDVSLLPQGQGTKLCYVMHGSASGKIVKLGSKLLSHIASKIADQFFYNIAQTARTLNPSPLD